MTAFLPLALLTLPLVAALISFAMPEARAVWRDASNILFALVKLALVGIPAAPGAGRG